MKQSRHDNGLKTNCNIHTLILLTAAGLLRSCITTAKEQPGLVGRFSFDDCGTALAGTIKSAATIQLWFNAEDYEGALADRTCDG